MAINALVVPYVLGVQHAATLPLQDPRPVRAARDRFGREAALGLEQANSFCCPAHRWPSKGWVLVKRSDYNRIDTKYATNLQLNFTDVETGTSVTFQNLAIVQAWCVSRGFTADPNALYLVELTDARGLIESPWFAFPTSSDYNVPAPAYPGQYYSLSLNSGSPWTWDQMVGDLWGQMGAYLGAYPHLPSSPSGTPEYFSFPGARCWDAMCRILDLLGMQVAVDPTNATTPFTIVSVGAADANFSGLQTKYFGVLEDDYEYIDLGSGRVPGSVKVLFHRVNQFFGTEETVRTDSLQWQTTSQYSVTVAAPAVFSQAVGVHYLWDDFSVRYDVDGNPLAADVATANAIAAERAQEYYNRVYRGTSGYLRQVYTGALPFVTGSMVDGVRWFSTDGRAGWRTEVIRGPEPPWPWVEMEFER